MEDLLEPEATKGGTIFSSGSRVKGGTQSHSLAKTVLMYSVSKPLCHHKAQLSSLARLPFRRMSRNPRHWNLCGWGEPSLEVLGPVAGADKGLHGDLRHKEPTAGDPNKKGHKVERMSQSANHQGTSELKVDFFQIFPRSRGTWTNP